MGSRTVLVLGAGIGGVVAAHALRTRLSRRDRVVLVNGTSTADFPPSYLRVMIAARQPGQIQRDLRRLARHGIDVRIAEVGGLDLRQARVETSGGTLSYDALILALGAELAPDLLPGIAAAAHCPYTLDGAARGSIGRDGI